MRKIKTGWEDCELFGFLTADANANVAHLQRPLPNGALQIVGRGERKDETIPA